MFTCYIKRQNVEFLYAFELIYFASVSTIKTYSRPKLMKNSLSRDNISTSHKWSKKLLFTYFTFHKLNETHSNIMTCVGIYT